MKLRALLVVLATVAVVLGICFRLGLFEPSGPDRYVGAAGCRPCHEPFYQKWAGSHHGLAMQPYTAGLAAASLTAQTEDFVIGNYRYRADIGEAGGCVVESGPNGVRRYRIAHALGGKNVFYFLTPLEKGRLQTLPVAYDLIRKEWFDTSASGLRHFRDIVEERVAWRERPYTFNTSCYSCHVSQLSTNYDLASDTYRTTWAEPGINCEVCHGPGEAHVRVCEGAMEGTVPPDLKIIRIKADMTMEQVNASCAPCHAKMIPITASFSPGGRFFDHYDLTTLEHPDFYADGRDLGENYTYTLWRMSPCAKSGRLDCIHCHTSSGRYKFHEEGRANEACLPCHEERVRAAAAHSNHPEGSAGNRCISCHMPMTEFARMRRSDHSMLPPVPAATAAFESPNACNICHQDKDAAWADGWVRKWHTRDYQAPVLRRAGLVAAARRRDWSRLPEMFDYIASGERDEVFANSLVRMIRPADDPRKAPVLLKALEDPSPLIRASAVEALGDILGAELVPRLAGAARDEYRLVRVRAAAVLARVPPDLLSGEMRAAFDRALAEYRSALMARPDDHSSHYHLGNLHMDRGDPQRAIASYETALRLEPGFFPALVNLSMAHSAAGRNDLAEQSLRNALGIDPANAAANLNLGLLLGEGGRTEEAKGALRKAFESDPQSAAAAYNLGVLLADSNIKEAVAWCRKAFQLQPEGKYGYTLGFYLARDGNLDGATAVLRETIGRNPGYADAYLLLADIYEKQGKAKQAMEACRRGLNNERLSAADRQRLAARLARF